MKKTITAIIALAGVATADVINLTPLTNEEGWEFGRARDKNSYAVQDATQGTLTSTNVNWSGAYAVYTLSDSITLQNVEDTMTVSFTILSSYASGPFNGNNWGVCMTGTLIGGDTALTYGAGRYDKNVLDSSGNVNWEGDANGAASIQMAVSDHVDYTFFNMKETLGSNAPLTEYSEATGVLKNNVALTLTSTIQWDATQSAFVATVTYGDNNAVLGTAVLGETFTLEKINLSVDTGQKGSDLFAQVSNLTVSANIVPEPTTATLSLLALAGLAARRRRK